MAFEGQRWGLTYSKFHKTVMAFGMLKCVKFCEMDPGMIMNKEKTNKGTIISGGPLNRGQGIAQNIYMQLDKYKVCY